MRTIALTAGAMAGLGMFLIGGAVWFVRASLPFAEYFDPRFQEPASSEADYIRTVSNGPRNRAS